MQASISRNQRWTWLAIALCFSGAAGLGWTIGFRPPSPPEPDLFAALELQLESVAESADSTLSSVASPSLKIPDVEEFPPSTTVTAHLTNHSDNADRVGPVWLIGTIEPLDETSVPSVVPLEVRQAVGYEHLQR